MGPLRTCRRIRRTCRGRRGWPTHLRLRGRILRRPAQEEYPNRRDEQHHGCGRNQKAQPERSVACSPPARRRRPGPRTRAGFRHVGHDMRETAFRFLGRDHDRRGTSGAFRLAAEMLLADLDRRAASRTATMDDPHGPSRTSTDRWPTVFWERAGRRTGRPRPAFPRS